MGGLIMILINILLGLLILVSVVKFRINKNRKINLCIDTIIVLLGIILIILNNIN